MIYDDGELPPIILPNDPFWLLNVEATRETQTPFHLNILWCWQFALKDKPIPTLHGYLS